MHKKIENKRIYQCVIIIITIIIIIVIIIIILIIIIMIIITSIEVLIANHVTFQISSTSGL